MDDRHPGTLPTRECPDRSGIRRSVDLVLRRGFLVAAVLLTLAATRCSSAPSEKKNGDPCTGHAECASNLCTIPPTADGGAADSGPPTKRCVDPDVSR